METTPQNPPTDEQLKNAERMPVREILKLGLSINDAQQTKLNNSNVLLFNTEANPNLPKQNKWIYATESLKQAETIAKTINGQTQTNGSPKADLTGLSFSDGKDRLDIKAVDQDGYTVKRVEDHPFLKDKKSIRDEKWQTQDLHAAIDAGLLSQTQTYAYTTRHQPYEMSKMKLRNIGLINIESSQKGSILTFDHPVTIKEVGLSDLSAITEAENGLQKGKHKKNTPPQQSSDTQQNNTQPAETTTPKVSIDTNTSIQQPSQSAEPNNEKTASSPKVDTAYIALSKEDYTAKFNEMIGKHQGIGVSPEQPVVTKTSKGVEFQVDRIKREGDGTIRIYGNDDQNKERSVSIANADVQTLQKLYAHLNEIQNLGLTPKISNTPAQENKENKQENKVTQRLGSEARKILALSKLHSSFKKDCPANLIFIRLRDPETKKLMYQTFGDDAKNLIKQMAQKVETLQPIIRDKQYITAILRQDQLPKAKDDIKTIGAIPIIINAKGEYVDNDHFLGFTGEEINSFSQQTSAVQKTEQQTEQKAVTQSDAIPQQQQTSEQPREQKQPTTNTELPGQSSQTAEPTVTKTTKEKKSQYYGKPVPDDAQIQFDVHKNTHVPGMFDIRLYVNGEKAGAHRLTKEDRDRWRAHQVPVTELMRKYFPKELANANLHNLTWFKAEQKAEQKDDTKQTQDQQNQSSQSPQTAQQTQNGQNSQSSQQTHDDKPSLAAQQTQPAQPTQGPTPSNPQPEGSKDDNLKQQPQDKPDETKTLSPKDYLYIQRATAYQTIADRLQQQDRDAVVVLQMQKNDGNEFFQTFNRDAEFVAEFLNRKVLTSADNKYISLTQQEIDALKNQIGENNLVIEKFSHKPSYNQQNDNKTTVSITPDSRIEYTILPVMHTNKETQQQVRIPGMFALTISTDGQNIARKTLTKEERDLLNAKPGEITNVINAKFTKELNGVTLDFKQVHRPAVSDEEWKKLNLPNGMKLDEMPRINRNDNGKYEMTVKIEGTALGPKQMFRQDVNDFFDHAKPIGEIAARVFREELKTQVVKNNDAAQNLTTTKNSPDEVYNLWHLTRYNAENADNNKKIAFIQREGKFGTFYQTFGDDAKNMSKITNRSLRVIDTEKQKNVIYANVSHDQISEITRMLRKEGYQPFAINGDGQPVTLSTEQNVKPPKSMALADGRIVDEIALRNAEGKWLMSANINGTPLPEREISHKDAVAFKQGQQNMSNIVFKYYAQDFNQTQEEAHKRSLTR